MGKRSETYAAYGVGCAAVWGAILLLGRRRLDASEWRTLRLVCGGWWIGWASASIARIGLPPAKPLTATGSRRLRNISVVLVALGLADVAHMLVTSNRPRPNPPDRPPL